jgi:hypothetical protein
MDHRAHALAPGEHMTDSTEAIQSLLVQAERAHGDYEATELNGVYDENWPRWYATYAVDHGIGRLIGHEATIDRLAERLAAGFAEFKQTDPAPDEPWSAYLARRIAADL